MTYDTYREDTLFYFPVGHPVVIKENFGDPLQYFGILKVTLTPPTDLLIPVIGSRTDNKFLFDLRKKVETVTSVELALAVEMGYVINEVHEVHHWEEKSCDLFKDYVCNFYTMKLKAGGWNKFGLGGELTSELENARQRFIADHRNYMGLDVDYESMCAEYNPAMYQVAKVCLNSLWGKFAQREDYSTTEDFFTEERLDSILTDPLITVSDWVMHTGIMDREIAVHTLTYAKESDYVNPSRVANVPLAAFTTAHARCRLYSAMRAIGFDRVLYCDTDSLVVLGDASDTLIMGAMLGDLTNELGADEEITDFVAMAPKTYGYQVNHDKVHFHAKGFSIRTFTEVMGNLDPMKELISLKDQGLCKTIAMPEMRMQQRNDYSISVKHGEKAFKAVEEDKRVFTEGGLSSVPYGWAGLP